MEYQRHFDEFQEDFMEILKKCMVFSRGFRSSLREVSGRFRRFNRASSGYTKFLGV